MGEGESDTSTQLRWIVDMARKDSSFRFANLVQHLSIGGLCAAQWHSSLAPPLIVTTGFTGTWPNQGRSIHQSPL